MKDGKFELNNKDESLHIEVGKSKEREQRWPHEAANLKGDHRSLWSESDHRPDSAGN